MKKRESDHEKNSTGAPPAHAPREDAFSLLVPSLNLLYFIGAFLFAVVLRHPIYTLVSLAAGTAYYLVLAGPRAAKVLTGLLAAFVVVAALNPFFNTQGEHPLFSLFGRPYTLEALCYGVVTAGMFVAAMLWFLCFERIMTGDKLTALLGRSLPALSLLLVMVLRLVPAVGRKANQITTARSCIGLDQGTALGPRLQSGMTVLSAMTSWFLEGSVVTADSMRARGYGSSPCTSFYRRKWKRRDIIILSVLAALMAFTVIGVLAGCARASFLPTLSIQPITGLSAGVLAAYAAWLLLPTALHLGEQMLWRIKVSRL